MAILVVYLLSNLGTFGKWAKVATVVFAATVCLASFLPVDEILSRLSLDATADLPRQYYFLKGLEVWTGYPLFGIGYGTFGATRYRDLTHDYIFNNYNVHKFDYAGLASTDSFVSEVIPEYGIVGIALLLVIVCIVLKAMRTNGAYAKATSPLLVASLVLAFNSSTAFTSAHVGFYFWLALGLMFSSSGVSLSKRCSLEEDPNDE